MLTRRAPGNTPGGNLPGRPVCQRQRGRSAALPEPRSKSPAAWAPPARKHAGTPRTPRTPRPSPSGPPPRRARALQARAPATAPLLSARRGDANSPPGAASGIFVYIRARGQARLWCACHKLAIIFTHARGSPGSSGNRCAFPFLSAGAPSSPPFLPGCNLLYLVSSTGWALQRSVSRQPQQIRLAVTG